MSRRGGGRRRRPDSGVSGCVVIDKPAGCTSHDVVDDVRRALGTRKVGHAGTLDPDATGVLVLGVGSGTKLLQFVTGSDKIYHGRICFGTETSTLDAAGEVTARHEMNFEPAEAIEAAKQFVGDIEQIPPMVSAVKVDGRRLHELAREGTEVERKPRPVTVHRFEVTPTDDRLVYEVVVECSSGTYIRTLAADLGHALGGGAHLCRLRRTAVGPFTLDDATTLPPRAPRNESTATDSSETLSNDAEAPIQKVKLLPVDELVRGMPVVQVEQEVAIHVANGRSMPAGGGQGKVAVKGPSGDLLAIYEVRDRELRPVKVLSSATGTSK